MTRYDVLVLGGGIIGASVAEELARRGQRVCLIERGTVGCESSKAAAGILSAQMDLDQPGPFFELCQRARALYPRWVAHLERQSGLDVGYRQRGILYLVRTNADGRRMVRQALWQRRLGLRAERWSSAMLKRQELYVCPTFREAWYFPMEAEVDNVTLMEALAAACRKAKVALCDHTEVRRLLIQRRRVVGVETARGHSKADVVVNCIGSWASQLAPTRLRLPVAPARGQMLEFDAPKNLLRRPIMSEIGYGIQRRDGRLIVGSTVEQVGFDRRVTLAGMQTILSGFARLVDPAALRQCRFRSAWAGLRPRSQDGLPILGSTAIEGLYVATGHFRHGILLAPVTAHLLTELILTGRCRLDLEPFSPTRFS